MIPLAPLQRLHDLDRDSPQFHEQLSEFLRGDEYRGIIPKLQREDFVLLAEYLDNALVCISDHASPAFRVLLHELGRVASGGEVLPKSCAPSESLLRCMQDSSKVRIECVRTRPGGVTQRVKRTFHQVVVTWKHLKHPNIAPLLGATTEALRLVSDRMPGEDLRGYIAEHPDVDRNRLLSDVAEGLKYLHSCDVVHGDLKGGNILVDAAGRARITDGGLAMVTQDLESIRSISVTNDHSTRWVAPEILENKGIHSKEADMFSFAGVAIETFTGADPFSDKLPHDALLAIAGGERPPRPTDVTSTDSLWVLIQRCWNQEAHLRPHVLEVSCALSGIPAWKYLIGRPLGLDERISLISDIFSDHDETREVRRLCGDDAQSFVDLVDELLDKLAPELRRKCQIALGKLCGRQALLPRSVQIPLCYNRAERPLYHGGFSEVWKGEHQGRQVAVKVLTVYMTSDLKKTKQKFCKEVMTWKALRHPNVVPLLGVTMTNNQFMMVSEWMSNGNINEFIKAHGDANRFELLQDVIQGLIYMHSERVMHGDLKGDNILINQHGHACLADFGLSAIASDPAYSSTSRQPAVAGTERWMSPELLDPALFGIKDDGPTKESDCYALGMVILEVLSGEIPFTRDCSKFMVMMKVREGERPGRPQGERGARFTDDLWRMLQACWSPQPKDRPTIEAILECLKSASQTWQSLSLNAVDFRMVLLELGVDPQLIPFVTSTVSQVEQLSTGPPPLTQEETENLVESLHKIVMCSTVNAVMRNRCFRVLRKVSQTYGILPKSYHLLRLVLSNTTPYASGGFADIWKGQVDGRKVSVKAFRTQTAANLGKIKRRFYRDIIGWKCASHPNVVPFLGVSETVFPFCVVSPWLPNGNILEYINKNRRVNRLQLLTQAACGLEYLHSLSIVHSDINPGNILIDRDGTARLGDFGIVGVITDPTVVEPGSTTTSKPGVVRYMAPELLNPTQFHLQNSNPTRESDVYSLAMTAYEVLADILPYGRARDGIIIFHVVTGDRPPRPQSTRCIQDPIWNMIITCWNEQRELRWDIRAVHNQLSASIIQEVAEGEKEVLATSSIPSADEDSHPSTLPHTKLRQGGPIFVEEENLPPHLGQRRFKFSRNGGDPERQEDALQFRVPRPQKWTITIVNSLRVIFRFRKSSKTRGNSGQS